MIDPGRKRFFAATIGGLSPAAWGLVAALLLPAIGLLWDGAWHLTFGRDSFWSPPHLLLYAGVTLALFLSAALIAAHNLNPHDAHRHIRLGRLHAPAGAFIVLAGALTMLAAAPFDDWWHNTFGRDSGLWSPPHLAGLLGGALIGLGAMIFLSSDEPGALTGPRLWATFLALGCFTIAAGAIALGNYSIRHEPRIDAELYPITACLAGAFVLVLAQRVTGRAGAATITALIQFSLIGGVGAALTTSGYDRVVSLPPMTIVPAIALDALFARFGHRSAWPPFAGLVFASAFFPAEAIWARALTGAPWLPAPALTAFFLSLAVSPVGAIAGDWLGRRITESASKPAWASYSSRLQAGRIDPKSG